MSLENNKQTHNIKPDNTNNNSATDDSNNLDESMASDIVKNTKNVANSNSNESTQDNLNITEQTTYGKIKPQNIEKEMQDSYLDYAMSVIVARALPDVRDGLKPVHRRILYSMNELGLGSRAKYRKSATVVGDVLGKYHPHGDIAVYDSLVRMAQPFSMRYRLVDGQGNFGSMDGDSAAAMRYTEARMTALSEEMLADIDKNTVDFSPNYDGSREEPQVLPSKVPQLLLNGSLGIAVGMATNIPTHNLTEICDGTIQLINNPELTIDELMQFIKGPDFPTGANIYGAEDIKMAYETGKGKIVIRASADIEETKRGYRIVVSQIPYQVNKAELIVKIADLVKEKRVEGITDLRDESDRKDGVRIVIELKANAYPKKVLNKLFELTPLQTAFHVNMIALIDGIQPKVLNLKNVLEEFIKHRQIVVRRRTQFDLDRTKDRIHILEGLKIALDHIDEVIATIKQSETKEIAHNNLMSKFLLSDKQATAILEMKLSSLAGLERKKIDDELAEKLKLASELEAILASNARILEIIKTELEEIKEKFGDARRTKIFSNRIGQFTAEDLIPNEQVVVSLTKDNYVKRVPADTYHSQGRGGKGVIGMETKEQDVIEHLATCYTHDEIMFFTNKGRVFTTRVYELPASSRTAKGQAIINIIQIAPDEKVTAMLTMNKAQVADNKYFFMATTMGVVKKTEISAYQNIRKTGLIAIKLNNGDSLKWVVLTTGSNNIIMATKNGQGIQFNESDVRPMGRSAAGVRGIKLRSGDRVIAVDVVKNPDLDLVIISGNGIGKRTKIVNFTLQKRGGYGLRAAKVTSRNGEIVEAFTTLGDHGDLMIISKLGQTIRVPLKSVKRLGRDTQGVTLIKTKGTDQVASITLVRDKEPDQVVAQPKIEFTAKESKAPNTNNVKNTVKADDNVAPQTNEKTLDENTKNTVKSQENKKQVITENKIVKKVSEIKVSHYQSNKKIDKDINKPNYWGNSGSKK